MDGTPIRNPFAGLDDYNCFGCDPDNVIGLRLNFVETEDGVAATWAPRDDLQGYPGVIHGGVQATLADEVAAWYVYAKLGVAGITRSMQIEYKRPARIAEGPFVVRTTGREPTKKSVIVDVVIQNQAGEPCAVAAVEYAIFSPEISRKRFNFPGREAFRAQ